jgi:hypothetical protein
VNHGHGPGACDNCGRTVDRRYALERFQGRIPYVCGDCLERIVAGIVAVVRATQRRAA